MSGTPTGRTPAPVFTPGDVGALHEASHELDGTAYDCPDMRAPGSTTGGDGERPANCWGPKWCDNNPCTCRGPVQVEPFDYDNSFDRLKDIVDEAFGPFPVQLTAVLMTTLEKEIFAWRKLDANLRADLAAALKREGEARADLASAEVSIANFVEMHGELTRDAREARERAIEECAREAEKDVGGPPAGRIRSLLSDGGTK